MGGGVQISTNDRIINQSYPPNNSQWYSVVDNVASFSAVTVTTWAVCAYSN